MSEISDLLTIDDNNTTRWPEGMPFNQVNNSARADEGMLARWFKDTNGSLASSGSANAYAVTANRTLAAYLDKLIIGFTPNFTSTSVATLNVSGLGNVTITRPDGTSLLFGDIVTGQPIWVVYILASNKFQMMSLPAAAAAPISIPVGTVMIWPTEVIPAGCLEANGQSVTTAAWPALFAACGYRYGGSGANFNLPNYAGYFLRGHDNARGIDPNRLTRTDRGDGTTGDNVGTVQADDFASHQHGAGTLAAANNALQISYSINSMQVGVTGVVSSIVLGAGGATLVDLTHGHTITGSTAAAVGVTGNETRSKNIYVKFIVIATPAAALPTSGIGLNDQWIGARLMTARANNGATSGTRDTATNHLTQPTFSFDNVTQQYVIFEWTPPKRWNRGTVTFVPQWTADAGTDGNNVRWTLAGVARNDNDATDLAVGTAQSSTEAKLATGKQHTAPESAAITIAGTINPGCTIIFQLSRDNTVGTNLAAAALLFGAKLRWTSNAVSDN